jgi:DNA-binding protein H-NS
MATKKKDNTVDTAADVTETAAPTKSLFGMAPKADEPTAVETATETAPELATELPTEGEATAASDTKEAAVEAAPKVSGALDGLSVEELRRQQEAITAALNEKTNAEKAGVLEQIAQVIGEYGITTEEVVNALGGYKPKRVGTPAKIKFRDKVTGNEWSGRGKEPLWIKGKDRAQFAVAEEAAPAA